jgi:hypothetical protein
MPLTYDTRDASRRTGHSRRKSVGFILPEDVGRSNKQSMSYVAPRGLGDSQQEYGYRPLPLVFPRKFEPPHTSGLYGEVRKFSATLISTDC